MVGGRAEPWRIPLSVVAAAYQTITYYAQPRHVPLLEGIQKRSFGSDLFLGLNVTSPSPRLGTSDRLLVPDICTHNPPPPNVEPSQSHFCCSTSRFNVPGLGQAVVFSL